MDAGDLDIPTGPALFVTAQSAARIRARRLTHFITYWSIHMHGNDNKMIDEMVDVLGNTMVRQMTPLEIGRMLYPTAIVVELKHVPTAIIADHRSRYSKVEIKKGQFFKMGERYTFIMDHVPMTNGTSNPCGGW
jgi:hypothetical protein